MAKSILAKQKWPGRPATGQTPMVGVRATDELRVAIERWAKLQPDTPKLSEAVRRLVEMGIAVGAKQPAIARSEKTAAKAKDLAAKQIDRLAASRRLPKNRPAASDGC
jgi:hypothetical protein